MDTKLDRLYRELDSLRRLARTAPASAAVEEVHNALEEVRVAEQELRERDEELLTARQALESERERYRDLFDFAPDAYVVTNEHGVVREANYAATRLLNVPPRNLVGKPLAVFVAPDQRKTFRQEINSLLSAKEPPEQQWVTSLHCRGRSRFRSR